MEDKSKKPETIAELTGREIRLRNLRPPFKKGEKVKGAGHPKGQRNFITIYREALKKLAVDNNTTELKLENEIVAKGIVEARKGNYSFYKDTLDRTHGQAMQPVKVELNTEALKRSKEAIKQFLNDNSGNN